MSAAIRKQLSAAGLTLAIEADAVSGHEFTVTTNEGQTIAYGWTEGGKKEAAREALAHPGVQLKLRAVTL